MILPNAIIGEASTASLIFTIVVWLSGSVCWSRFKKFPAAVPKIGKNTINMDIFYG